MIDQRNSRESHVWVEERLSDYLDNQLPPLERAQLERHLQGCSSCQRALASLQWAVTLLKQAPSPKLPRSFTLPVPPQPARAPLFGLGALRLATAMATLILISLIGIDLITQFGGGTLSSAPFSAAQPVPSQPTFAALVPPAVPPTSARSFQVAPSNAQPTQPALVSPPTSAPAATGVPAVPTAAELSSGPSAQTGAPAVGALAVPTVMPTPTAPSRLSAQPLAGTRSPLTLPPTPTAVPFGRGGGGPPETAQSSKSSTDAAGTAATAPSAATATPVATATFAPIETLPAPPKPAGVTDSVVATPTLRVEARVQPTSPVSPPPPLAETPRPALTPLRVAEFGALFVAVFLGTLAFLLRRR